jgi:FkbM family methyltransferase
LASLITSIRKRMLALSSRPRRVRRLGAEWMLDPRDWIDRRLIVGQPFEAAQLDRLGGMMAAAGTRRLLDVGANFGLYSVLMALRFPGLAVDAFEPVARSRAKLEAHLAMNGLSGRVRVHGCALSDRDGAAEIAIDPGSTGLATLAAGEPEQARRSFAAVERVPVRRLDGLIAAEGEAIALKIDVEGHELAALAGMERLLARNACLMQIEVRPRHAAEVTARLEALGYRAEAAIAEDMYFVRV